MIFRRTLILTALLSSSLAAAAAAPASQEATATTRSVQTRHARRVLIVRPQTGNLGGEEFVIKLKDRARRLGVERAGVGDRNLGEWFSTENFGDGFLISVKLTELPQPVPPVAAEIADQLVEWVRQQIQENHQQEREEAMRERDRQLAIAQRLAANAEAKLKDIREKLRELSGRSDVTPATLTAALTSMDDELQRLRLEALAKESRRKALEEEIAAATARVQKSVEGDAIAAELRKVVEAREHSSQTLKKMFESGQASQQEMHDAIARVAEARAKMLQQQRDAAAAAGGNALESFNKELMTLSIDSRELEAKVKYLEERLPRLREAVEHVEEFRFADLDAKEASARLTQATRDMQELKLRLESLEPPRVLIKESENLPLQ